MSEDDTAPSGLRDRIARQGEDALGKLAQELLENPLVNSAIAKAFEARERAVAAQETAMGALNIPSAADIERADPPAALGIAADGGDRGGGRPARSAPGGADRARQRDGRPSRRDRGPVWSKLGARGPNLAAARSTPGRRRSRASRSA